MKNDFNLEHLLLHAIGLTILAALLLFAVSGCTTPQPMGENIWKAVPATDRIPLYWENTTEPHPERKPWSDALIGYIDDDFEVYDKATDTAKWCPKYKTLSYRDKLKAWGELYVALAYYESSFNPRSASVDVGKQTVKDTWSAGLFQVSVVDQPWAGGGTKYSYNELLTPLPNIHLATILMRRQMKNTGLVFLRNSSKFRYWAVALQGNRYSKIPQIIERVKKHAPKCY